MPEEIEVPTEHLHEAMHEEAHSGSLKWVPQVALSAAVMAVIAAIASLFAGHHANEGVLENIKASDQWNFYQSKGIKSAVLTTKVELLRELDKTPKAEDVKKIDVYAQEQKEIKEKADEFTHSSERHMDHHNAFARTVTLFQIAIALAAISVLSRKKWLWFCGLALSLAGLAALVQAVL